MLFGLLKRNKTIKCCYELECANAWGHQKFDGKFYHRKNDKQIDVNNKLAKYGFIKDFQVNYIDGIRLKGHEVSDFCKSCDHS